MTSKGSTLTKCPSKMKDYCLAKYSKILRSYHTKAILVRAKLPKRLLHVDLIVITHYLWFNNKLNYITTTVPENWPSLDGISGEYLRTLILGLWNIRQLTPADWPSQTIKIKKIIPHTRQANIRGMNKIVVVFNIDTILFKFKLVSSLSCRRLLTTLSCRKIDLNSILWVPASAISIPRNTSITNVNMAALTNSITQIKIPPCTFFTDRAQH